MPKALALFITNAVKRTQKAHEPAVCRAGNEPQTNGNTNHISSFKISDWKILVSLSKHYCQKYKEGRHCSVKLMGEQTAVSFLRSNFTLSIKIAILRETN